MAERQVVMANKRNSKATEVSTVEVITEENVSRETTIKEDVTMKMERANRITVSTTENGFEGRFYRTHKLLATVTSDSTEFKADESSNATTNREMYRNYLIEHSAEWQVEYNPNKQEQAWERKYNRYDTDEQVAEDTITLLTDTIDRLADKCRYDMSIDSIEVTAVTPKESTLTYVEDGRYTKSGAWCVADIEVTITCNIAGQQMDMLYKMEMKSGQICKPKMTIADWNEMVGKEMELNGIEVEQESKEA